jgi:tryptophan synthase alpha subunit
MTLGRLAPVAEGASPKDASQAAEILRIFAVGMMANTAIVDRTDNELANAVKKLIDLLVSGRHDPASDQG